MEQFIRYLYEYQEGKRTRNAGFVKASCESDSCELQIHGKGTGPEDVKIKVYLLFEESGKYYGIPMGELEHMPSVVNCRLTYDKEEVEPYTAFTDIMGLMFHTQAGRKFLSSWNDAAINPDLVIEAFPRGGKPEEETKGAEENQEMEEESVTEQAAEIEEEPEMTFESVSEEDENPMPEMMSEEEQGEEPAAAEIKEEPAGEVENCGIRCSDDGQRHWRKIKREQISDLATKDWRLANNSFLLHGYYNYKHLLLVSEEGMNYMGVPGIYHPREETAAAAFGFTEFRRFPEVTAELTQEEFEPKGDFGYWCKRIEAVDRR